MVEVLLAIIKDKRISSWIVGILGFTLCIMGGMFAFLDIAAIITIVGIIVGAITVGEISRENKEKKR